MTRFTTIVTSNLPLALISLVTLLTTPEATISFLTIISKMTQNSTLKTLDFRYIQLGYVSNLEKAYDRKPPTS